MEQKIIIIGRHTPDLGKMAGQFEIVETRNIQFPARASDCSALLGVLYTDAGRVGAAVLFQAVPGQLAIALARTSTFPLGNARVGVIVSKPGPREAGLVQNFDFRCSGLDDPDYEAAERAAKAVRFANPNAKIARGEYDISITVDPPARFIFSHIEWLG